MGNKLNFKIERNKVISLGTLASLCVTMPCVYSGDRASASMGRAGSVASRVVTGVNLNRSIGGRNSLPNRTSSTSSSISTGSRISTSPSRLPSTSSNLTSLSQRLLTLENQRELEIQKSQHPLTKTLIVSGLVSSGALVAGVVGGLIQQSGFRDLQKQQAEIDQSVQEDLANKRYYFQEKEIPEAEQTIIDYYKENYGIDITQ